MNARRELVLLIGLSLAWVLSVWTNNYQEFSSVDSGCYFIHCFIVLLIEALIYLFFSAMAKKERLPAIVPILIIAVFCVANFYLLILAHNERVAGLGAMATILLVLVLFLFCFAVLSGFRTMALEPKLIYALVAAFILNNRRELFS